MVTVSVILLVASFILLVLAACSVPSGRINLTAAGLACFVLTFLLPHVAK